MSNTPLQICCETAVERAMSENLRLFRQARGWSQSQLAYKVGCSIDTISRVENGRNSPKLATFMSLCLAFNVGPETLLGSPEDFAVRAVKGGAA